MAKASSAMCSVCSVCSMGNGKAAEQRQAGHSQHVDKLATRYGT